MTAEGRTNVLVAAERWRDRDPANRVYKASSHARGLTIEMDVPGVSIPRQVMFGWSESEVTPDDADRLLDEAWTGEAVP